MRVLSGVQPSGAIHLGHYFGAIREHVSWQNRAECLFLIADYHALTTSRDGDALRRKSIELAAMYLACGLDPARASIYVQSDVPEVCELAWILGTIAPMGTLERAVAFKEARQRSEKIDTGLFNYPLLMSADILGVAATLVPVGRDQLQHIEMARDLARRFNHIYASDEPVLSVPEARLSSHPFVPGTDGEKMSKRYDNTIGILESEASLSSRIQSIRTESKRADEPKDPDRCTVFALISLVVSADERQSLDSRYRRGAISYAEAKRILNERLLAHLRPVRERYAALISSPTRLEETLSRGASTARELFSVTMTAVRQCVGAVKNRGM